MTRTKTQDRKNEKPQRNFHRPISMTIETVSPIPEYRVVPHETQIVLNLKGNRKTAELLIAEIQRQIANVDFFAVTIEGPS